MDVERSVQGLQQRVGAWRAGGRRIGFVPTMGYLHRAHTTLMRETRPHCDVLVASIYVNPLQFLPGEDFSRYPRDEEGDTAKCAAAGVDVLFLPPTLYPPGFSTKLVMKGVSDRWEGEARPGHFDGVATVVARLFGLVQPDVATFGEKDFQQLAVIRAMVRDLAMAVEVRGGALVRDEDGVALSSRNVYLSEEERRRARSLSLALSAMATFREEHPEGTVAECVATGAAILEADSVDYLAVVDSDTLEPLARFSGPARALVAGRFGKTRLLDNLAIG